MKGKITTEIVSKHQIFHLLMLLLEHAKYQTIAQDCTYEAMARWLKFQHPTDWQRYQSSIHLLGDTEEAIRSGFMYQLGDISNSNRDYGGIQLRLYGILNAVYLQMSAYEVIMNLLNYPERQDVRNSFHQLDIYKLRGIAGAHTVDYLHDEETIKNNKDITKITSFSILQYCLNETGERIEAIDKNGIKVEYNLLKVLTVYEKMATDLLVKLVHFTIQRFYKKKEDKAEMKSRLNELLPNLIDYTQMNENGKYRQKQHEEIEELIRKSEQESGKTSEQLVCEFLSKANENYYLHKYNFASPLK